MSVPSNEEIFETFNRLDANTADDLETNFLEFKLWNGLKDDLRATVEYAVCLANAEGGAIVFGDANRVRGGRLSSKGRDARGRNERYYRAIEIDN